MSRSLIIEFSILVSPPNFHIKLLITMYRSFIYIMNKSGQRTEPCGTPLVNGVQSEEVPLTTTLCFFFY